jgi:hypothetical protein
LALAGLFLCQAAILAILLFVGRLGMTAEIGAVDFDFSGQRFVGLTGADGFTEFVAQNKRRLILNVQVATELKGGDALNRVHKQSDGKQIVPDRELAASKDRPAGDAELVAASLALPNFPRGEGVDGRASAPGAKRRTAIISKPDRLKPSVRFVICHSHNALKAETACLGGKEEVLTHGNLNELR